MICCVVTALPSVEARTKHRQFSMPHSQTFSLFRRNHAASCRYAAARPVHGALMRAETPDGMLGQPCILASDALTSKQLFLVAYITDLAKFTSVPLLRQHRLCLALRFCRTSKHHEEGSGLNTGHWLGTGSLLPAGSLHLVSSL